MTRRAPKGLTEQDRAVWQEFASPIRRLPGRPDMRPPAPPPPPPAGDASGVGGMAPPRIVVPPPGQRPLSIGDPPGGVDRALWQRFRSGSLTVQRRLDLHGHTAQHAFARFEQVIAASAGQGLRCIEIITGRGSGEAGGVLRRELPMWLNLPRLRPLILAASHPHPGNPGSVRLLLRRSRHGPGTSPPVHSDRGRELR